MVDLIDSVFRTSSDSGSERIETDKGSSKFGLYEIEAVIRLIRKGNAFSLAQARQKMGITRGQISAQMGVSEITLEAWELERNIPPHKCLIQWRLKLSDFLEEKIADYIRTDNPQLIQQFWELLWMMQDFTPRC